MRKLALLLLASVATLGAQDIFQGRPRQKGVTSFVTIPAPSFAWAFSEGYGSTVAAQVGSTGLTCTNLGWAASPTAGDFNGTTSECTADADILVNLTTWTVSYCLQADTTGENSSGKVINKGSGTATNDWWVTGGGGAGVENMNVAVFNTSEAFDRWNSPAASLDITDTVWAHWAVVFNCPTMTCTAQWYKDGSAVTTSTDNSATGTRRNSTGFTLRVGNRVGDTARTLDARLRLLKVWPTTMLSAADVAALAAFDVCNP